jgi:hypothetical protein
MNKGAFVDGPWRYYLYRSWVLGSSSVAFVMLNPSIGDAEIDDQTIRKCIGFAKRWGVGSIEIINLYARRATDPNDLAAAGFPIGPLNDPVIMDKLSRDLTRGGYAQRVIVAWGTKAARSRADTVMRLIRAAGHAPEALAVTKYGAPQHPLYIPYETSPQPYCGNVHPWCYAWARARGAA